MDDFELKIKALYAIALECFNELCGGLPEEVIVQRLDSAISEKMKQLESEKDWQS